MNITFTPLGTGTAAATFWSGAPHIARNRHGRMAAWLVERPSDGSYNAQLTTIRFCPSDADYANSANWVEVWTGTVATNCPVILAEAGNDPDDKEQFYAVFTDWTSNLTRLLIWPDISAVQSPVHANHAGTLGGKFGAALDQKLNRLFVMGIADGNLRGFRRDGSLYSTNTLFTTPTANSYLQYPGLQFGPDGQLAMFGCSTNGGATPGVTSYGAVFAMTRSHDANWFGPRAGAKLNPVRNPIWDALSPVPIPADYTNPACVMGVEDNWPNTFISGFLIDEDYLHIAYSRAGDIGSKILANDAHDSTTVYTRYCRDTGRLLCREEEMRAGDFRVKMPGVFFCRSGGKLRALCAHKTNIVLLSSEDDGDTWTETSRAVVPHTAPAMIHYLNGMIDGASDDAIEATLTLVPTDWDGWVTNPVADRLVSQVVHVSVDITV